MENRALYFRTENCSVCDVLRPKLMKLFEEKYPKMEWVEYYSKTEPEKFKEYQVMAAPTLVVEFDGKETHRFIRAFSLSEVSEKIDRLYEIFFG